MQQTKESPCIMRAFRCVFSALWVPRRANARFCIPPRTAACIMLPRCRGLVVRDLLHSCIICEDDIFEPKPRRQDVIEFENAGVSDFYRQKKKKVFIWVDFEITIVPGLGYVRSRSRISIVCVEDTTTVHNRYSNKKKKKQLKPWKKKHRSSYTSVRIRRRSIL